MSDPFASPWENVARRWQQYYFPPGRPSQEDCQWYRKLIRASVPRKNAKALVLGATPEIRNVLHEFSVEVTSIDINLEMILAMNQFVTDWQRDLLVRASWVDNPLKDDYFDVILGDYSWSNVPQSLWKQLNTTLQRVLKLGGHYIHPDLHAFWGGQNKEWAIGYRSDLH